MVEFGVQDKIMVHLDNTHSRFTSKIVTYSIIVVHQKQSNQVEKCIETLVKSLRSGSDGINESNMKNIEPLLNK